MSGFWVPFPVTKGFSSAVCVRFFWGGQEHHFAWLRGIFVESAVVSLLNTSNYIDMPFCLMFVASSQW